MSDTFKIAYIAIEDDMCVLSSSAGVLHLAFADFEARGKGKCALAQSLYFTARSIEAACQRIEATLYGEAPGTAEPCACQREEAAP